MPSLLSPSASEAPAAAKAIINVVVVCGTFFVLTYFVVFNDPHAPLEKASALDYFFALEPLLALVAIMLGVRNGWLDWTKEQYDRMKFPLSGAELLTFVGFISGFCFAHQLTFPILPASDVNLATYGFIGIIALVGLFWTSQQDKSVKGKVSIWSAIWYALMMVAIGAEMFLTINMASASRTERMVLANVHSKYSTSSAKGISRIYYVDVTSPTDSNSTVSLAIDYQSWNRKREGDAIKLRLFRGGLGQDYWQYELPPKFRLPRDGV
jgi:hypothetical protein